jgi:hypothetical protein
MLELREAGKPGLGDAVEVAPHFAVRVDIARGKLPCPFGHPGLVRKAITRVRNLDSDREIAYTDLQIHLIGEHGFYQGTGSPFRHEIRDLMDVLEIEPIEG